MLQWIKKSRGGTEEEEEEKKREDKMKDLVESVELGVSKRKGVHGTRPKVWLRNELLRIGLAESLCTYVMMVRHNLQHRTITCSVIKRRKNASHGLQSLFPPSTLCL